MKPSQLDGPPPSPPPRTPIERERDRYLQCLRRIRSLIIHATGGPETVLNAIEKDVEETLEVRT